MTESPEALLSRHGIRLQSYAPGNHGAVCPECSHLRQPAHRKLECLIVLINSARACWNCHHCGWRGPEPGAGGGNGGRAPWPFFLYAGGSLRKVKKPKDAKPPPYFWQHRDESGEWAKGLNGADASALLYRDAEVRAAIEAEQTIYVVEGEKDADNLWRRGLAATTNAHGAAKPGDKPKWKRSHSAQLAGADLVILNDNDPQGVAHAAVAAKLSAGVAKSVRRLVTGEFWKDAPDGGDISDWFDAGHSAEELTALATGAPLEEPEPPRERLGPPWTQRLRVNSKEVPYNDLANALIALRAEPGFQGVFGFDEMQQTPMLLKAQPLAPEAMPGPPTPRPLTDDDVGRVQEWMQYEWDGLPGIARDTVHQAVDMRCRDNRIHPLRDWLNGLVCDAEPRVGSWLHVYLGAEDNAYTREIGKLFLISMIARIMEPGCKCDYMLILEGGQGDEKSTACAVLAGDYFSDQLPDITNKDSALHLRGKWLIEVAELSTYSRAAVDHFKGFLTRTHERYRPPYGRKDVIEPRQVVFIGTTNKSLYLRDETGNRRFWPVKIGKININKLRADREKLLAEAVKLYRDKVKWWPEQKFEAQTIAPEQEARYEPDVWEDPIADWLAKLPSDLVTPATTTLLKVAIGALGYDDSEVTPQGKTSINRLAPRDQQRISSVLTHLGWVPNRDKHGRWWEPTERWREFLSVTPAVTPW
jgi:hypothetical protein